MFNLGMGEITIILLLALIFLGPKKLPELASGLGKLIREIRKTTSDVKNEIQLDEIIRKPMEELREAMTLHPEELKRRDRLKKELEELKRKAEEASLLAHEEGPDAQDVAEQAAAQDQVGGGGDAGPVAGAGGSMDGTVPEGVPVPPAAETATADAAADVKTPAPVPQIPRAAPTGTVAREPSSAIPAAPAPGAGSAGHSPPAPPLAAVLTRTPAAPPAGSERRAGTAGTDFLRSLRAVPDARQTTATKPLDAATSAADRGNTTQTLTEADLAAITVGPPTPPAAPGQTGKTQPPPPPSRLPGATPRKTSNR